jgi:glutamyl-tRNA reductase
MSIFLVGLNHRTAPVALREQFSLAECGVGRALHNLRGAASEIGVFLNESVIISTCNRLEVYAAAPDVESGSNAIDHFLAQIQGRPVDSLRPHLYRMHGIDAIEQLMRVACGLDSMILGEHQVLGQVASALTEAQSARSVGPVLSRLFEQAVHAGKRARTETTLSRQTTSISHAAVKLAQNELGSLEEVEVLIIGAGEMADLAARALMMRGVQKLTFINRTYTHAADLADSNQGKVAGWNQLTEMLKSADVVVTATGAPHTVLHTAEIAPLLLTRTRPRLLIMDIAVPRDVEESVGDLPDVKLFDIDDLLAALDENLAQRQAQVPLVEAIIAEEQRSFVDWMHSREVVPLISDLHQQALTLVNSEMERALRKLDHLAPEDKEVVRQLGYRIASKLLHEPTVRLKAAAADGRGISYADAIRELFALEAHNATPDGLLNHSHNDGSVVSGD